MSAALAVLKISWPYLLCAIVAGYLTNRLIDTPRYDALQTKFARYQSDVADTDRLAQKAAADALQDQIKARLDTESNNAKVLTQLQSERDSAVADAQFARRLLAAAQAKSARSSGQAAQATGGSGAPDPAGGLGDQSLVADLTAAAGECRNAINTLIALQNEIRPQL